VWFHTDKRPGAAKTARGMAHGGSSSMRSTDGTRVDATDATPQEGTTLTLTPAQAKVAQYPILVELQDLLESAAKEVHELHESSDLIENYPLSIDLRLHLVWVQETIDALDALGWQAFVERHRMKQEEED
jgi:hypothetical protein